MKLNKHFLWIFSGVLLAAAGCQQDAENVENALTCEPGLEICGQSCCADTCIDNVCVNTKTDNNNCGEAGRVCIGSQVCTNGECLSPEEACGKNQTWCKGDCINIQSDVNNCGGCGITCEENESCKDASCFVGCSNGYTLCDGQCIDTKRDSNHCGSCGVACKDGESCIGGGCQCAPGRYDCDGIASNGCESTRTCACTPGTEQNCWLGQADNRNQGACKDGTQVCDNSGQFWGQCTGGTYPSAITCNDAGLYIGGDQNCNGVADTQEECVTSCDLRLTDSSYISAANIGLLIQRTMIHGDIFLSFLAT